MEYESNGLSRRERERNDRRSAMLEAAKAVFAERGYAGATLEEIAGRAEFGKGTLYNYFPNGKEEILVAIFDQLYDGLCDLINASFENVESRPFPEVMQSFVGNCFRFFSERYNLFMILVKEAERLIFSDSPERVAYFSGRQDEVVEILAVPLKAAMDRGELRRMSPQLLAHMLFVNIKGCQSRHCPRQRSATSRPVERAPDELAQIVTDMVLYGVAATEMHAHS